MRTPRLLLTSLALAAGVVPGAQAAGSCAAQYPGATYVVCTGVTCVAGDTVRVRVIGHAAGIARCGGATAFCETASVSTCTRSATATSSGTLNCSVDPIGTQPSATAVCEVPPRR